MESTSPTDHSTTSGGDTTAKKRVFDPDDDEELSHGQHMVAGALAGMVEHLFMFPVDTIKTRMQAYSGAREFKSSSVVSALRSIAQREGISVLWRGIGAVAMSAGPAHALYFATYEAMKSRLVEDRKGYHPLAIAACGAVATVMADAVMTPLDVVKQRMQLGRTSCGLFSVVARVYRNDGIDAFYRGFKTTLVMNIPYTAVQFSVYESTKKFILDIRKVEEDGFSVANHIAAGIVAGASAGAITNPFDVIKTRLQTEGEEGARRYRNMRQVGTSIWLEEGLHGFLRGIRPRIFFHAPAAAICWTTYEFSKYYLFGFSESRTLESGREAEDVKAHPLPRQESKLSHSLD